MPHTQEIIRDYQSNVTFSALTLQEKVNALVGAQASITLISHRQTNGMLWLKGGNFTVLPSVTSDPDLF